MMGAEDPVMSWADGQMTREALKERVAADIEMLSCPACGKYSYWNEGTHFTCEHCDTGFAALTENEIYERDQAGDLPANFVDCSESVSLEWLLSLEDEDL